MDFAESLRQSVPSVSEHCWARRHRAPECGIPDQYSAGPGLQTSEKRSHDCVAKNALVCPGLLIATLKENKYTGNPLPPPFTAKNLNQRRVRSTESLYIRNLGRAESEVKALTEGRTTPSFQHSTGSESCSKSMLKRQSTSACSYRHNSLVGT